MKKTFYSFSAFIGLLSILFLDPLGAEDIEVPTTISWGHFEIQIDYDPQRPGSESEKWTNTVSYSTTNEFESGQGIVRLPADEVAFIFTEAARQTFPSNTSNWGELAGQTFYAIPRSSRPAEIYLGVRAAIQGGIFQRELTPGFPVPSEDGTVRLSLTTSSGTALQRGGIAILYQFPQFSNTPNFVFDTRETSVGENTLYQIPVTTHAHYDWAFTKPGLYELTFETSGILNPQYGGQSSASSQLYRFLVPHSSVVTEAHNPRFILGLDSEDQLRLLTHDEVTSVIYPSSRTYHSITDASSLTLTSTDLQSGLGVLGSSGDTIWVTGGDHFRGAVGTTTGILDRAGVSLTDLTDIADTDVSDLSELAITLTRVEAPGRFVLFKQQGDDNIAILQGVNTTPTTPAALLSPTDLAQLRWGFDEPGLYRITLTVEGYATGGHPVTTGELDLVFLVNTLPGQTYAEWAANYERIGDLPAGTLANPGGDHDQDGIPNLFEYLLFWHGLSPLTADAHLFPQPEKRNGRLVLPYIRDQYRNPHLGSRYKTLFQISTSPTGPWQTFDINRPVRPREAHENTRIEGNAVGLVQEKYFGLPIESDAPQFIRLRTIQ